jgi:non-specific serine/threonine protein kinase/serine/threonine-protein kinase
VTATTSDPDDLDPTEGLPTRSGAPGAVGRGTLAPGARLGRYRIDHLLGRGGMGEVYRADQLEPVRRTVALKLLHGRRLDARHLAYFEIERQLLAQMRHPAIAQVFDAGTTPDGFPYFAMEYIEGEPLVRFCEQHRLPLRARLELFIRVCEGVQHAHQKGVIHRDLKPGNILVSEVDGRPLPKIIDFGIATAGARSMAAGDAPDGLERAGTPDYMSPEQAGLEAGIEVDTRSDVYSLGVLLFELLAGRRPGVGLDTSAALHTASTSLRAPWDQIATLAPGAIDARAEQLGVSRPHLRRMLRSELDWVVMKAMQRDRALRYASAAELADELRRFLDHRPLAAVPATRRYVLGTYLRRHRVAVLASSAIALAVLAGLALSLYGLQQAREQRALAERRSAELERVVAFQRSMLRGIDIEAMGVGLSSGLREQWSQSVPEQATAYEALLARSSATDLARRLIDRNILASALEAIGRDFEDQPRLAADLRESVAEVHEALGLYPEAEAGFEAVVAYREQALGAGDPATLRARGLQAGAMLQGARPKQAHALLEATLANAAALPPDGEAHIGLELQLSEAVAGMGDRPASLAMQQALHARAVASLGPEHPLAMRVHNNIGINLARTGDLAAGRALFEALYPLRVRVLGAEHEDTLGSMSNLAIMRAMSGDTEAAAELQRGLVAIQSRRLGNQHPVTLSQRANLANMVQDLGRLDEAEAMMREVLEARSRVLGTDSTDALRSRLNLAALLSRQERFEEGLELERQVIAGRTRVLGPRHPDTVFILVNHAGSLDRAGLHDQALARIREALPLAREVLGTRHPQFHAALAIQAGALAASGQPAAARPLLEELLALRIAALGPQHADTVSAAWDLVKVLVQAGDAAAARAVREEHVAPLLARPEAELDARQKAVAAAVREDGKGTP